MLRTPLNRLFQNPKTIFKVALVFVAIGAVALIAMAHPIPPITTTHVQNVFADVNGDGKPDLIVNGEVILNTSPLSPTVSRP